MTMLLIGIVVLLILAALVVANKRKQAGLRVPPTARKPLTKYEQPMYFRLRDTFPNDLVLAQVAFSALLKSTSRTTRNTFDRNVADFVICTKAFEVVAIIELDDSSHREKASADLLRDEMLRSAGYQVLRFPKAPDIDALKAAVAELEMPKEKPDSLAE